jgi:hypothetical protein
VVEVTSDAAQSGKLRCSSGRRSRAEWTCASASVWTAAQEANGGHAGKVRLLKSRQRRGGQRLGRGVRRLAARPVAASRVVTAASSLARRRLDVDGRGAGDRPVTGCCSAAVRRKEEKAAAAAAPFISWRLGLGLPATYSGRRRSLGREARARGGHLADERRGGFAKAPARAGRDAGPDVVKGARPHHAARGAARRGPLLAWARGASDGALRFLTALLSSGRKQGSDLLYGERRRRRRCRRQGNRSRAPSVGYWAPRTASLPCALSVRGWELCG